MFSKFAFVLFVVGLTPCLKYFNPLGVAATTCETKGFLIFNAMCEISKERNRKWRADNKEKISQYNKEYRAANKEKTKLYNAEYYKDYYPKVKDRIKEQHAQKKDKIKEYNKKYQSENRAKVNKLMNDYILKRRKIDPLFKLRCSIRGLILLSIKKGGGTKSQKTEQILGCTIEFFKAYLEGLFTDGMNWSNQGKWHLDHKYPVGKAIDEKHLMELNHYTNFQPLWAIDNLIKGDRI